MSSPIFRNPYAKTVLKILLQLVFALCCKFVAENRQTLSTYVQAANSYANNVEYYLKGAAEVIEAMSGGAGGLGGAGSADDDFQSIDENQARTAQIRFPVRELPKPLRAPRRRCARTLKPSPR